MQPEGSVDIIKVCVTVLQRLKSVILEEQPQPIIKNSTQISSVKFIQFASLAFKGSASNLVSLALEKCKSCSF